jgi:hypothetical protein
MIDSNNRHDDGTGDYDNPDAGRSRMSLIIDKQEKNCPRTFNIIFFVTVPLLILICLCMFCGHFLALLERDSELKANDAFLASHVKDSMQLFEEASEVMKRSYDDCIDIFIGDPMEPIKDAGELKKFMKKCTDITDLDSRVLSSDFAGKKRLDVFSTHTSFNWNTCSRDGLPAPKKEQGQYLYDRWVESKQQLYAEYSQTDEIDDSKALELAIDNATAGDFCKTNSAGGAMFWFTIMTTIGYGNTAPVTKEGQILVMSLGFISILAFGAVSGAAGYVTLMIIDDVLQRCNLERLTKGWGAIILWLVLLFSSFMLIASFTGVYLGNRIDANLPKWDLFWYSFISTTTIGLGDTHIPHETFNQTDMFLIPLVLLFGFICFTNFLIKISEKLNEIAKNTGLIDDESLGYLLEMDRSISSWRMQSMQSKQSNPPEEVDVYVEQGRDGRIDVDTDEKGYANNESYADKESYANNESSGKPLHSLDLNHQNNTGLTDGESLGFLHEQDRSISSLPMQSSPPAEVDVYAEEGGRDDRIDVVTDERAYANNESSGNPLHSLDLSHQKTDASTITILTKLNNVDIHTDIGDEELSRAINGKHSKISLSGVY